MSKIKEIFKYIIMHFSMLVQLIFCFLLFNRVLRNFCSSHFLGVFMSFLFSVVIGGSDLPGHPFVGCVVAWSLRGMVVAMRLLLAQGMRGGH